MNGEIYNYVIGVQYRLLIYIIIYQSGNSGYLRTKLYEWKCWGRKYMGEGESKSYLITKLTFRFEGILIIFINQNLHK